MNHERVKYKHFACNTDHWSQTASRQQWTSQRIWLCWVWGQGSSFSSAYPKQWGELFNFTTKRCWMHQWFHFCTTEPRKWSWGYQDIQGTHVQDWTQLRFLQYFAQLQIMKIAIVAILVILAIFIKFIVIDEPFNKFQLADVTYITWISLVLLMCCLRWQGLNKNCKF